MGQRQHGVDHHSHCHITFGVNERHACRHHGQQPATERRADPQLQTSEGALKGAQPEIPPHLIGAKPVDQRGGLLAGQQIHRHILMREAPAIGGQQCQSDQGHTKAQY
ncbi:hypothetical protein D3C77_543450 [compost metagenome]